MDPTFSSGIDLQRPISIPARNTYTADVAPPQLWFAPEIGQVAPASMLLQDMEMKLSFLGNAIHQMSQDATVFNKVAARIDPLLGVLPISNIKFTREYYDMKTLDSLFGLLRPKNNVLLCTPRAREYFVESKCIISMMLLNSGSQQMDGSFNLDSPEEELNTPDDWFYSQAIGNQLVDYIVLPIFNSNSRWTDIDAYTAGDAMFQQNLDLVVLDEDSWAHTIVRDYDSADVRDTYDEFFVEPLFKTMDYLKSGGSMVIKFVSLGSRVSADIAYILKFIFGKISIVKTATSLNIAQNYYLVAQRFNLARFQSMKAYLLNFINSIEAIAHDNFLRTGVRNYMKYFSIVTNLQDANDATPSNAVNFKNWFTEMTNEIAIFIGTNMDILKGGLLDIRNCFLENQPAVLLDHTGVRAALGYFGRSATKLVLPAHDINAPSEQGIVKNDSLVLDPAMVYVPSFMKIVYGLHCIIDEILTHPEWRATYEKPFAVDEIPLFSTYQEWKDSAAKHLQDWFALLWSTGDLIQIYTNPAKTDEIIAPRLISPVDKLQPLTKTRPFIVQTIQKWIANTVNIPPNSFTFRCVALANQRFRLTFAFNGVNYALGPRNSYGVVGEYEILNMLTTAELESSEESVTPTTLSALMENPIFRMRVFEHIGLPSLFSSSIYEAAVPDLYFKFRPDLECFASASNRHAPFWCSANPADVRLGSLGSFFALAPSNPLFMTDIRSIMAFPPKNLVIFQKALNHIMAIYNHQKAVPNRTTSFRILLVFENTMDFTIMVDDALVDNAIIPGHALIDESYNPFTGTEYIQSNLKIHWFDIHPPTN